MDLYNVLADVCYSTMEAFQDLGASTQIGFNQIKVGLLNFVLDAIKWWRELPFTKDDAFSGLFENCQKAIDETTRYINNKQTEIDELEFFRLLPSRTKDTLITFKSVLTDHFGVPMEQLLSDTEIWSKMTIDEFYKLPAPVQEALRAIDESLAKSGDISLAAFLAKSKMTTEGIIFSFDQLDADIQSSMSSVEKSLMDLNGVSLEQFVLECQTVSDGGKTAFEALPEGVRNSISGINEQLGTRHRMTLYDFIINIKKATGEYVTTIDTSTKDAKDKVDKNTKELASNVDANTKKAKDNAKRNMDSAAKEVGIATSNMAKEAKKGTSELAKNIDSDMKKADKFVKNSAKNMNDDSKKSYTDMANHAKNEASRMYNGVNTSVKKMSDNAKKHASAMYNGVTTSTRKMADKAIADWDRVRRAYSKPINGKVTNTTVNKTVSSGKESRSIPHENITMIDNIKSIPSIRIPDISKFAILSKHYNSENNTSSLVLYKNNSDSNCLNILEKQISNQNALFSKLLETLKQSNDTIIENHLYLDDKQIIKSTARGMEAEINSIQNRRLRFRGE